MFDRSKKWIRKFAFDQSLASRERRNAFEQESVAWRLDLPNETPLFFDRATAMRWVAKTGAPESNLTQVPHPMAQPQTLEWLHKQRLAGMDTGSDAQRISSAGPKSVDLMIAWFNGLERFDAAAGFALLNLGFAANRPDVIDALAECIKGAPWFWFNYTHLSGPPGDTAANNVGNESSRGVFSRMLQSATLTHWVFEHHPELKDHLLVPEKWAELQKGLGTTSAEVQAQWPWIAHNAFGLRESPWDYKRCTQQWHTRRQLNGSFTHDPAAQCFIAYSVFKESPWIKQTPNDFPTNMSTHPDAKLFHTHLVALQNNETPPPTSDVVSNLFLGVHLDMGPREFYQHACLMFHQQHHRPDTPPLELPSLV